MNDYERGFIDGIKCKVSAELTPTLINASNTVLEMLKPVLSTVLENALNDNNAITDTDVQPVDRWISVKDRLPDEGERVLIYAPRTQNQYYVAMFYTLHDEIKFTMNIYGMSYCWYANDVTHWQPLPEPLKDGDTE